MKTAVSQSQAGGPKRLTAAASVAAPVRKPVSKKSMARPKRKHSELRPLRKITYKDLVVEHFVDVTGKQPRHCDESEFNAWCAYLDQFWFISEETKLEQRCIISKLCGFVFNDAAGSGSRVEIP